MMDWSAYADNFMVPFKTPPLGRLYNGILTLTLPDGGHRTFRVRTGYPGTSFAGKRIIGILVGPSNSRDYDDWAFVEPEGIRIFKRVLGSQDEASAYKRYADILWRLAGGEAIPGYSVEESRSCLRCNRTLTTPHAVMVGLGSECEKMTAKEQP